MNIVNITECPLCGKTLFKKSATCIDHYVTGESFDICRCLHCGFLFTQNVPCESEIGKYYDTSDYISHSDTHKGIINSIYHQVRRYMLSKKARLIERISGLNKGVLLDIGTGTGYFSGFMKKRGWQVYATEKSPQARNFAEKQFKIHVDEPEMLNDYKKNSFDVITLWHVMEHLERLNQTWEKLNFLLKERGILLIAVPDPNSFDANKYKNMWAAYDVPRHLWHFTPSTMQQFGAKHGFILAETHAMPFDVFYISILTEKYKKSRSPLLKGLINGTKGWLSSMARKEQSSSIIYIFRKKQL